MTERIYFLAARAAVVATRPAILILLARITSPAEAAEFGKMLVAAGVGMLVSAFDSGKHFYGARLQLGESGLAVVFHPYVARLALTLLMGLVVTMALAAIWGGDLLAITMTAFYLVTERITEERQRYLLVTERVSAWSMLQLRRGVLQFACFVALAVTSVSLHPLSPAWFIAALCTGNLIVSHPSKMTRMMMQLVRRWPLSIRLVIRSVRQIVALWPAWASGLLASSLGFADRVIIAAWDDPTTAGLLVATTSLSIGPIMVSVLFFTPRRGAIVRRELSAGSLRSRSFLAPWIGGLTVAAGATLVGIGLLAPEARPTPMAIITLTAVSGIGTVNGILREIRYFGADSRYTVIVDAISTGLLLIALVILYQLGAPVWAGFLAAAVLHGLRCLGLASLDGTYRAHG